MNPAIEYASMTPPPVDNTACCGKVNNVPQMYNIGNALHKSNEILRDIEARLTVMSHYLIGDNAREFVDPRGPVCLGDEAIIVLERCSSILECCEVLAQVIGV